MPHLNVDIAVKAFLDSHALNTGDPDWSCPPSVADNGVHAPKNLLPSIMCNYIDRDGNWKGGNLKILEMTKGRIMTESKKRSARQFWFENCCKDGIIRDAMVKNDRSAVAQVIDTNTWEGVLLSVARVKNSARAKARRDSLSDSQRKQENQKRVKRLQDEKDADECAYRQKKARYSANWYTNKKTNKGQ